MELNSQVVSLELAKKLKELGVRQETYFVWVEGAPFFDGNHSERDLVLNPDELLELTNNCSDDFKMASAFTVAELGEMLPRYLVRNGFWLQLEIIRSSVWRFYYGQTQDMLAFTAGTDDTEADARAKCLIYLIENGFITGHEKIPVSGDTHSGNSSLGETS